VIDAVVGLCAKTGSAVAVTLTAVFDEPTLADRRTIDMGSTEHSRFVLHEAQALAGADARRFVQRCETSVHRRARTEVDAMLRELGRVDVRVVGGAVVDANKPFVAPALDKILASHSLVHAAEGELYRSALVAALARRDIDVECIPRGDVASCAARALGPAAGCDRLLATLGQAAGPPWRREHKDAALAALAALASGAG
jgi:hypothetical protein